MRTISFVVFSITAFLILQCSEDKDYNDITLSINGTVTDIKDQSSIPGASVQLREWYDFFEDGKILAEAVTDANGFFSLYFFVEGRCPMGMLHLVILKNGYDLVLISKNHSTDGLDHNFQCTEKQQTFHTQLAKSI